MAQPLAYPSDPIATPALRPSAHRPAIDTFTPANGSDEDVDVQDRMFSTTSSSQKPPNRSDSYKSTSARHTLGNDRTSRDGTDYDAIRDRRPDAAHAAVAGVRRSTAFADSQRSQEPAEESGQEMPPPGGISMSRRAGASLSADPVASDEFRNPPSNVDAHSTQAIQSPSVQAALLSKERRTGPADNAPARKTESRQSLSLEPSRSRKFDREGSRDSRQLDDGMDKEGIHRSAPQSVRPGARKSYSGRLVEAGGDDVASVNGVSSLSRQSERTAPRKASDPIADGRLRADLSAGDMQADDASLDSEVEEDPPRRHKVSEPGGGGDGTVSRPARIMEAENLSELSKPATKAPSKFRKQEQVTHSSPKKIISKEKDFGDESTEHRPSRQHERGQQPHTEDTANIPPAMYSGEGTDSELERHTSDDAWERAQPGAGSREKTSTSVRAKSRQQRPRQGLENDDSETEIDDVEGAELPPRHSKSSKNREAKQDHYGSDNARHVYDTADAGTVKGSKHRHQTQRNDGEPPSNHRPAGMPDSKGKGRQRETAAQPDDGRGSQDEGASPAASTQQSRQQAGISKKNKKRHDPEDEEQMQNDSDWASSSRMEAPIINDLERAFQGDVSHWGKTDMPELYDEEDNDGSQVAGSFATLSSGLSPRDTRPRLQPFDYDAATKALQYQSGLYARAQTMRREGTTPTVAGITDDLPTRLAYQQLNVLAGMAGKVQDAILHNKKVFEQRMMLDDRACMKRTFHAWRAARYGSIAKQKLLHKACARIARGMLSRAFYTWKDKFHLVDSNVRMKRKVEAIVARGLLRRTFLEWKRICEDRWWKTQYDMRDRQILQLESKIRGYERRPIVVLRKRKLREMIAFWRGQVARWRKKRLRFEKAVHHFVNLKITKAWHSWMDVVHEYRRRRAVLNKAAGRMRNVAIVSAWSKWRQQAEWRKANYGKLRKAAHLWTHQTVAKAWNSWLSFLDRKKHQRQIMQRWMNPHKARALSGWYEQAQWKKRMRLTVERACRRLQHAALAVPFEQWLEATQETKMSNRVETSEKTVEDLGAQLRQLKAENERLQRDNERFVRLIDSGEWGRGRVSELVQAGEVLKGERDALFKLISSLRKEYEAVQQAKSAQDEELQRMKEKMMLGGHARNRMLIKGGSSFNALVRAMKQDLVEARHTAQSDANLLYEIDKLSMDRVQVFPDGELNVQAVTTAPNAAAFAQPISTGRHRSSTGSTGKVRSPNAMQSLLGRNGQSGSSLPASPTKAGRSARGGASGLGAPDTISHVLTALKGLSPAEQDQLKSLLQQHKDHAHTTSSPNSPQVQARGL